MRARSSLEAASFKRLALFHLVPSQFILAIKFPANEDQHSSAVCACMDICIQRRELIVPEDHNSLLIYGSLKKPTMDRFARVTHYSTAISMVACLVMALAGFLTFGDKTLGNVLNNFPNDNIMVNVARL